MQEITITIRNTENVGTITEARLSHYAEIIEALVTSGALDGVKGGQTIIHFDEQGIFKGVQLSYWPWRRKKVD